MNEHYTFMVPDGTYSMSSDNIPDVIWQVGGNTISLGPQVGDEIDWLERLFSLEAA